MNAWYMIAYCIIPGLMGLTHPSVRWTCLMLDLEYMLSIYLKRCYHSLKSIKLCANMAVKNMFTSDLLLDPGDTHKSPTHCSIITIYTFYILQLIFKKNMYITKLKINAISFCYFLHEQEFPSKKLSWWAWHLPKEQVLSPERWHFLSPKELPGMTCMITSGMLVWFMNTRCAQRVLKATSEWSIVHNLFITTNIYFLQK